MSADMDEQEIEPGVAITGTTYRSGVTIKKIRGGHSWDIAVGADDHSREALMAALEIAFEADEMLQERYPESLPEPKAQRPSKATKVPA